MALIPPSVPIGNATRGSARASDENLPEKIPAPDRVLRGKQDRLLLEEGFRLSSDLAGARLLVLPGIGHLPQEEAPEEFSRAVSQFLDEVSRR